MAIGIIVSYPELDTLISWHFLSAQLADQRTLRHLFQAQRGNDLVDVWFFVGDGLKIDPADRPDEALLVE